MTLKFKDVFTGTQAALSADPAQAHAVFQAQSRLGDGLNSTVAIRQFSVGVDEPLNLFEQFAVALRLDYCKFYSSVRASGNHRVAIRSGGRHRFFNQHVFAGCGRLGGLVPVELWRTRNDHRIHIRPR